VIAEWEGVLLDATRRVHLRVAELARSGEGTRTVGVGAAGDRTILADKVAEDELVDALSGFKDVRVLSEEAGALGKGDASVLAVIDPLDGSSNFGRRIPFYCTSVAMVEGESVGDITFGIVRDLVTGDVYTARRGEGATKNGRRIRTSGASSAREAVVGIDLSRSTSKAAAALVPLLSGVKRQVHLGANALEICYVADGRFDSFVDARGKIRVTDFAAAYLIAVEAGARVTDAEGKELSPRFDLEQRYSVVASANETLHKQILELCAGRGGGKVRVR